MLKINKKLKLPLTSFALGISGIFLSQYLTFIPKYSNAVTTIETPIVDDSNVEKRTLADITYMRDITPEICANTLESTATEDHQKQLIDSRDRKSYWVAKLKDNQCWMTQNLDYDDPGGIRRDGENSPSDWADNDSLRQYWDPGYKIRANGTAPSLTDSTEALAEDTGGNTNAHYLQGNYYSWLSAVADDTIAGVQGICPDAWELSTSNNTTPKPFGALTSGISVGSTLVASPYYFMYGGSAYSDGLDAAGSDGGYWSSMPYDSDYSAYLLEFGSSYVNPVSSNGRQYGFSVCCVASGTATPVEPEVITTNPNVSVIVPKMITLDISDSVDIATESNEVNTGNFTATVESNKDYTISLNAATDAVDATSLTNYKDGNKIGEIPTITTSQPQSGISSWGIMLCNGIETTTCINNYQPLPTKNATNTFASGTKGTHQHLFQIGIGIGPELPSGTYTTSIQVTASQK